MATSAEFQSSRFDVLGRYATALFRRAAEDGQLERIAADIGVLRRMMTETPDLNQAIADITLDSAARADILDRIFIRAGLSETIQHFVGLVIHNRRGGQLSAMIKNFEGLMAAHKAITHIDVETASAPSGAQKDRVQAICRAHFGDKTEIEFHLNPDLVGGITLQMAGQRLDASMIGKLARLEKNFAQNLQTSA